MNDSVAAVLTAILDKYGEDISRDPHRVEALLRDLAGQHKREIAVLAAASRAGVPDALLGATSAEEADLLAHRLAAQLEGDLGLASGPAAWAVTTWAAA